MDFNKTYDCFVHYVRLLCRKVEFCVIFAAQIGCNLTYENTQKTESVFCYLHHAGCFS